jgi:hypothetical protein
MKPIWYYVGWVLILIGSLVLASGIYYLFVPMDFDVELRGMNISVWWGLILILGGTTLMLFNRKPDGASPTA